MYYLVTRYYLHSNLTPQSWLFEDEETARNFYEELYENLIFVANERLIIREINPIQNETAL